MTRSHRPAKSALQRIRSLVCLFALVLLQVPAISAAVIAATGACCSTDNCPIAAHHHNAPQAQPSKPAETGMDCDHENGHAGKMRSCSLSCCQTEQSAVHGHFFLLTPEATPPSLSPLAEDLSVARVSEPSDYSDSFSPPPEAR